MARRKRWIVEVWDRETWEPVAPLQEVSMTADEVKGHVSALTTSKVMATATTKQYHEQNMA